MAKEITMQDVAEYANVSVATVSRVLNQTGKVKEDTRARVMDAISTLGFVQNVSVRSVADTLGREQARQNSLILLLSSDGAHRFDVVLSSAITKQALRRGYQTVYLPLRVANVEWERVEDILIRLAPAGIIITTQAMPCAPVLELAKRFPTVICSSLIDEINEAGIASVTIDNYSATYAATKYLLSIGHRKLAYIGNHSTFAYSRQRMAGFHAAMKESGLPVRADWTFQLFSADYFLAEEAAKELFKNEELPDAVLCCADVFGMAVVNVAGQFGIRVPQDLSVIGFDDLDIASMTTPALTTVAQPVDKLASQACELLLEEIGNGTARNRRVILPTDLVIRNSTGPKDGAASR